MKLKALRPAPRRRRHRSASRSTPPPLRHRRPVRLAGVARSWRSRSGEADHQGGEGGFRSPVRARSRRDGRGAHRSSPRSLIGDQTATIARRLRRSAAAAKAAIRSPSPGASKGGSTRITAKAGAGGTASSPSTHPSPRLNSCSADRGGERPGVDIQRLAGDESVPRSQRSGDEHRRTRVTEVSAWRVGLANARDERREHRGRLDLGHKRVHRRAFASSPRHWAAQIVKAGSGVSVDHRHWPPPSGGSGVAQQRQQHGVLEQIGEVAGVEGVAIVHRNRV